MRLIDAEEAYKVLTDYYHQRTEIQHDALKEAIERVPTVDAVEIVRCKDCKWYERKYPWNGNIYECSYLEAPMDDNDYCSWGERREDGTI